MSNETTLAPRHVRRRAQTAVSSFGGLTTSEAGLS